MQRAWMLVLAIGVIAMNMIACTPEAREHDASAARDAGSDAGADAGSASIDAGPRAMEDAGSDSDAGMDAGAEVSYDAGPRPPSPVFTDVTESAGLADPHVLASECVIPAGERCEVDYMTGGAAAGDYDGDGWTDLYVTMLGDVDRLYRNRGDGTFADATSEAGLAGLVAQTNGAAFVDIENDGDLDLYVTAIGREGDPINARYYLFVNDGAGRFTEDAIARGAALDDGARHSGQSIAAGDYDRDGYADLFVTEWLPRPTFRPHNRLLRNRGPEQPGHFEDVTVAAGALTVTQRCWDYEVACTTYAFSPAFSDLDEDGWPDLVVVADFGTTKVFWNRGDGTFEAPFRTSSIGGDENGMGSTIGDIDGDGDLDWLVTSIYDPDLTCELATCNWRYSGNRLYRNEGGRSWYDATDAFGVRDAGWGWGVAMFDHDNDMDLDVVATNGIDFPASEADFGFHDDPMRFWDNAGGATALERAGEVGLTDRGQGRGLLVFDYDEDGDLDVFLRNNAAPPRLYRNDGGNAQSWLRVRLIGASSTREAHGARVWARARPGAPRQERELGSATHFLGQSERVVHFGLGPGVTRVAELEVRWPSGRTTRMTHVEANRTIELTEP